MYFVVIVTLDVYYNCTRPQFDVINRPIFYSTIMFSITRPTKVYYYRLQLLFLPWEVKRGIILFYAFWAFLLSPQQLHAFLYKKNFYKKMSLKNLKTLRKC